ncbi:hypothetical protein QEZ52_03805 [Aliisedimentitalea scapharcae]|uniref:Sensory transduction regulator n=1 Tax=Aliisedimentitalea scapharcae TaxID=1524259 RepID=A0ABZ2XWK7_9RHOB
MPRVLLSLLSVILAALAGAASAQEAPEPPMSYERLGKIIFALDPEAQPQGTGFRLTIADVGVLVVTDTRADRMRAMVPIRDAAGISAQELMRMMQANFDSALDARYAVANGTLWAVFIHPLSPLEKNELILGLGQAVNVAKTYGTLYSGGGVQFGGGDSNDLQRQLIEDLLERGEEI